MCYGRSLFKIHERTKTSLGAYKLIYFIQAATIRLIKIGKAVDCQNRLKDLQTGSPDKLHLLKEIYTSDESEHVLHNRFSWCRSHGEWFRPDEKLLAAIKDLPLSISTPNLILLLDSIDVFDPYEVVTSERKRRDRMGPGTGLTEYNQTSRYLSKKEISEKLLSELPSGRWNRMIDKSLKIV